MADIIGTPGIDTLTGTAAADLIQGGAGDDLLTGGAGDDTLDGGTGGDIAVISGLRADFILSGTRLSFTAQDTTNPGAGTDLIQNVEYVQFDDGLYTVSGLGLPAGPVVTSTDFAAPMVTAGGEFRVNTTTANDQQQPTITALADGGFVVSWQSDLQDGSSYGVYAQRYDAAGAAVGGEFRVNTVTVSFQASPTITALADGGFVASWVSNFQDGNGWGIYAQRYDATGATFGSEFRVNTTTANDQYQPTITALADGGFVVAWASFFFNDGSSYGVNAQRYDAGGVAVGGEFQVNSATLNLQFEPTITSLADGGFVVSWTSGHLAGGVLDIYAQRYDANGTAAGPEFLVNTITFDQQSGPSVTGLSDGGFVVAWNSNLQDGSGVGVYAQRYDAAGAAAGGEFRVNTTTANDQLQPTITALADGGFVVSWTSNLQDGSSYGIYAQRYDSAGAAQGGEFRVNTTTANDQYQPTITALADGGFVVSWMSLGQDGSLGGIYAQRYAPDGSASGRIDLLGGTAAGQALAVDAAALTDPQGILAGSQSYQWLRDGADIAGATGPEYDLTGADIGAAISLRYGYTDGLGNVHVLTTGATPAITGNVAPSGTDDNLIGTRDQSLTIAAATLLGNDSDSDGPSALVIGAVQDGTGGTVVLNPDGSVTFTPTAGYVGIATFTYQAFDGTDASAPVLVQVDVQSPDQVLTGTPGNDTLTGGIGNDQIFGDTGDDLLSGQGGNDTIDGGGGNDTVNGGDGDDYLTAGTDGTGTNQIDGGAGNDQIFDYSAAGSSVQGGDGDDRIYVQYASGGTVDGGTGRDVLKAGNLDISQMTIANVEVLETGGGSVTATAAQLAAFQTITLLDDPIYDAATVHLHLSGGGSVDLTSQLGQRAATVQASAAGNGITVGAQDDTLYGEAGNDTLDGAGGNDLIYGQGGADSLTGGLGADTIDGGTEDDVIDGGDGDDVITDFSGIVSVSGGTGNDTITVGSEGGTIDGGADRDVLFVSGGDITGHTISNVEVYTTNGQTLTATAAQLDAFDTITWSDDPAGNTIQVSLALSGSGSIDLTDELGARSVFVQASAAGNSIQTGGADDTLYGNAGDDTLIGGAGADYLYGQGGNDSLDGGIGNDTLIASTGDNTISGGDGDDAITDNSTVSSISGGNGNDSITAYSTSGTIDGGADRDVLFVSGGDITGHTISNVEVYTTNGQTLTATAAQLDAFDTITWSDDPAGNTIQVSLALVGSGSIDLTDELGARSVFVQASAAGNSIQTGGADDTLYGNAGDDTLIGGAGADYLYGQGGNDSLDGGIGNDTLIASTGDSTISGGDGDDAITDSGTVSAISGGAGNDSITAYSTSGTIDGGADRDVLFVSGGNITGHTISNVEVYTTNGQTLTATAAQLDAFDTITWSDDPVGDTLTVSINISGAGAVDLSDELGSRAVFLQVFDANSVVTGSGDDTLWGGPLTELLDGGAGNDSIYGAFGSGNDTYLGGSGNDTIVAGGDGDLVDGGADDDALTTFGSNSTLIGGGGNDTLSGWSGADTLDGGTGVDTVVLQGLSTDFTFAGTTAGFTATYTPGGQSVDFLKDVEFVQFNDGLFSVASFGIIANGAPVVTGPATIPAMAEDATVVITAAQLLAGASDPNADPMTIVGLSASAGTLTQTSATTWDYTPPANFNGAVSFSYAISDGTLQTGQTANLTVNPVNDPPVNLGVVPLGSTAEDTAITITEATLISLTNDIDGDALSVTGLTVSSGTISPNGPGQWTYTPAANFNGAVTFSYSVGDGSVSAPQTASLSITPVNDAPTISGPVALGTILEDTSRIITLAELLSNASDADGPSLAVASLSANIGTVTDNGNGTWIYTPFPNDAGNIVFSYTVTDGTASVAGSAQLTITGVNDPPVVSGPVTLSASNEDTVRTITAGELLAGSSDPEGFNLSVVGLSTSSGTLTVIDATSWTYTPAANFNGPVTFSYNVSDGTASVPQTANLTLTPVNDAPVVPGNLSLGSTAEDTTFTITSAALLAGVTDVDGDTLNVTSLTPQGGGTLVNNNDGTWTWTPPANFNGTANFFAVISDGTASVNRFATVTYTPVNDAPVVTQPVTLVAMLEDGGTRLIQQAELLGFVTDPDGNTLSVQNLTASSGTLVNNGNGTWSFTPAANDASSVSFSYQVSDGTVSVAHSATMDLLPVNDAPVGGGTAALTASNEDAVRIISQAELLAGASDVDGDTLSVTGLSASTGTLINNGNGTWTFTPAANDASSVTFSYQVTDGTVAVAKQATLDLLPVNDAPVVGAAVNLGALVTGNARLITATELLAEATDVDGDALSVTGLAASSGTLVDNGDGTWSFTPAAGDTSAVTFSYAVSDGTASVAQTAALDLLPVALVSTTFDEALVPVGGEFRVNTTTADYQYDPSITALADGGFVASWISLNQDGSAWGVYAQRFDAAGAPVGGEFRVNTTTANNQVQSSTTALAGGGFVVSWASDGQDGSGYGIYAQLYDTAGTALGGEFQVNSFTTSDQYIPSVTSLASGGFVIAWESTNQDGSSPGVYGQRFDSSGNAVGPEFRVNSTTAGYQGEPKASSLADGGFVVVWTSSGQDSDGTRGIYAQRYDSTGLTVGGEFRVNTTTTNEQQTPTVTALADGGFVVSWISFLQDGSGHGVYGQRFDATGVALGGEFQVNTATASDQVQPTITALADGGFVVSWTSFGQDGDQYGIYAQRYDAVGAALGGQFRVNATSANDQQQPTITALADGGFAVAWASFQDGSGYGIYAQRYSANMTPEGTIGLYGSPDLGQVLTADVSGLTDAQGIAGGTGVLQWLRDGADIPGANGAAYTLTSADVGATISLRYSYTDGQGNAETVTTGATPAITGNTPPTVTGPVDLGALAEDGTVTITTAQLLAGASDAESNPLSVQNLSASSGNLTDNGDGTWSFTPAANDDTGVTFSYLVSDGTASVAQTATLDLTPVNDAPIWTGPGSISIAEDAARTFTLAELLSYVADPDATAPAVAILSATNGTVVNNGDGTWTFTPTANFNGNGNLLIEYDDGQSALYRNLTLNIQRVNDTPVVTGAVTLTASPEDTGRVILATELLAGATDAEGDPLSVVGLSASSGALVDNGDGTWSFTPAANDDAGVTFTYQVSDGTASVAQTATLDLTPVNDAPTVGGAVALGAINEDGTRTITLAELLAGAADVDGDVLSVTGLSASAGTLTNNGDGTWTYTPPANFNGPVTFSYQVSDGTASVAQTAGLTISAVNDAPTVGAAVGLGAINEDGTRTITLAELLAGAADVDGDVLSVTGLSASAGTLTNNGDGTWTYTPPANFNGSVTFSYQVSDGTASVAQTAGLTISAVNDAPVGAADTASTALDQALNLTAASLLANDNDVDTPTAALTIGAVQNGINGTVVLNPDGSVTFTPAAGFSGTATFFYQAYDGAALGVPTLVTVTVQGGAGVVLNGTSANNTLTGGTGDDTISGAGGNDRLDGAGGNDSITGGTGNDTILGGAGDDTIRYGTGNNGFDAVDGGSGTNDRILATANSVTIGLASVVGIEAISSGGFTGVRILGSSANNTLDFSGVSLTGISSINAGSGNDTVIGSSGNDTIIGDNGNDVLNAGDGDDVFLVGTFDGTDSYVGGIGNDRIEATANSVSMTVTGTNLGGIETISGGGFTGFVLNGTGAANALDFSATTLLGVARINGGSGNDTITGSVGNDVIEGSLGKDVLTGGLGSDTFDFNLTTHSRGSTIDRITDFTQGEDLIDLSTIDANTLLAGNDVFQFVGSAAYSGVAGQLRYDTTSIAGVTRVLVDTNGDRTADMEIQLTGTITLLGSDFVL